MELSRFEQELKAIDHCLSIVVNHNCPDVAGIYWNTSFLVTIPSGQIYDEKKTTYTDKWGNVHRTRPEAIAQVKNFLWRLQNEPDFLEAMTEPL